MDENNETTMIRTSYSVNGKKVATGEITSLPGCSQVAVFHSAFVLPQFRNQGVGKRAHEDRLRVAKDRLYDFALCTVESGNEFQIRNLISCGWHKMSQFHSEKTGHDVELWGKGL
jgi:GNAT superfamily N-acetyltransferase